MENKNKILTIHAEWLRDNGFKKEELRRYDPRSFKQNYGIKGKTRKFESKPNFGIF